MKPASSTRLLPRACTNISFHRGQVLKAGGDVFQILILTSTAAVLEHLGTRERKQIEILALYQGIEAGEVVAESLKDHATLATPMTDGSGGPLKATAAQQRTMIDKVRWLDALKQAGVEPNQRSTRARLVHAQLASGILANAMHFSLPTLRRDRVKLDNAGGDVNVLLPNYQRRGGSGGSRTHPQAEAVIQEQIQLERERPTARTHVEIHNEITTILSVKADAGNRIPVPSLSTISRRLDRALGRYEQALKLVGHREATNMFRETSVRPQPSRSLQVVQVDDVDSGVFLIDERTGLPFGRAFVTCGIDDFDKVPMGLAIGHEHRSSESAVNCILDGLLPKLTTRPEFGALANQWIGYGNAAVHLMDNPLYNHSMRLEALQLNIKSVMAWAKPRTPTEKTSIEHFNDLMKKRHFSGLPGWSDGDVKRDSVNRGMASAIMNGSQFKRLLVKWIVGDYLNTPGICGLTPKQRREKSLNGHAPILRWTYDQLRLFRMVHFRTSFEESGGIKILNLRYKSDALAQIRRQIGNGRQLDIFVDTYDLTALIVEHPFTKVLLWVPCAESPEYITGLTLRQQQLILKKARVLKMTNPSIHECVKARNEIAKDVNQMRHDHRLRHRQKAVLNDVSAVVNDDSISERLGTDTASGKTAAKLLMTDLEYQMALIDEVDVNDCEWSTDVI